MPDRVDTGRVKTRAGRIDDQNIGTDPFVFKCGQDLLSLAGAELRLRRDGDCIRPLGMRGTKSLGDYMTDRKVPLPLRDLMPLLARENEVLWLPGVGISESARVEKGAPACEVKIESL